MKNFELLAKYDVTKLAVPVDDHIVWQLATWRQQAVGSFHRDTETIYYRMPGVIDRYSVFNDLTAEWLVDAPDDVKQIVENVADSQNWRTIGRVMLVKLHPLGHVQPHTDEGSYAEHYQRLHLVVRSDSAFWFRCGDEAVMMRQGELWKFNHRLKHEVFNPARTPRVNLIIDGV